MELTLFKIVRAEKPREIAVHVLEQRSHPGAGFTEDILDEALAKAALSPADRNLARELVCGTVRWQNTLDWLIARKTKGRPPKPILRNLLRLGLYQLFWLDRIPPHAAVHETVESARRHGCGPQAGFVNALLRGYARESAATRELLATLKTTEPHLGYSHPEWLVTRWRRRWGPEQTAQLLEWNNRSPQLFARVNTLKIKPSTLREQWREEKVDGEPFRRDWYADNLVFELKSHPPLATLPSFNHGCFYVQDPGTLLAVRELHPQPGERLLDLCAAPGGKTTYIAQLLRNQSEVVAHDISPDRVRLVAENCARLGVTCVQTALPSTAGFQPASFHRILIDAPCSNSGVMRRRVDLRWRLQPREIARLQTAQRRLLDRAAPLLKPGGTLVYSTCSLEPEENGEVLREFLQEHPEYRLLYERELAPFRDEVDGAYVGRLGRVG